MKGDARRQDRHHALQIDEMESVNMLHCIVNRLCMFTHPQDNTRLNKQQTKQETPPMKANSITTQDDIPTEPVCSTLQEEIDPREEPTQTTTTKMRQIKKEKRQKDKTQHTQQKWSLRGWCNEDDTTRHDCVGKTSLFKVTFLEVDVKKDEHRLHLGRKRAEIEIACRDTDSQQDGWLMRSLVKQKRPLLKMNHVHLNRFGGGVLFLGVSSRCSPANASHPDGP